MFKIQRSIQASLILSSGSMTLHFPLAIRITGIEMHRRAADVGVEMPAAVEACAAGCVVFVFAEFYIKYTSDY